MPSLQINNVLHELDARHEQLLAELDALKRHIERVRAAAGSSMALALLPPVTAAALEFPALDPLPDADQPAPATLPRAA